MKIKWPSTTQIQLAAIKGAVVITFGYGAAWATGKMIWVLPSIVIGVIVATTLFTSEEEDDADDDAYKGIPDDGGG